ncbi:MAG: antitoxin HicB [Propionibacteriaceae bacterium]|jgi:DNA-directed RNA polymerase specialized sigma24 family protein|nr:antitoxin HicB [Propionibacteriaceae bacterium]
MSGQVTVRATRWQLGWDLELVGGGVTQVRTLARAAAQVRDYLDTVDPAIDHAGWEIDVVPEIGPALTDVRRAQAAVAAAKAASQAAARDLRQAVRRLREAGLSVSDAAAILGVSRGRISQLSADEAA